MTLNCSGHIQNGFPSSPKMDHILPHYHTTEARRRMNPKGRTHTLAFDRGIPYDFTTDYPERYLADTRARTISSAASRGTLLRHCPTAIRESNYATKQWNKQIRDTWKNTRTSKKQPVNEVQLTFTMNSRRGSRASTVRSSRSGGSGLSDGSLSTRKGIDTTIKSHLPGQIANSHGTMNGNTYTAHSILQKAQAESQRRQRANYTRTLHGSNAAEKIRQEHKTSMNYSQGMKRSIHRVNVAYYGMYNHYACCHFNPEFLCIRLWCPLRTYRYVRIDQ